MSPSSRKARTSTRRRTTKLQLGGERPVSPGLTLRSVSPNMRAKRALENVINAEAAYKKNRKYPLLEAKIQKVLALEEAMKGFNNATRERLVKNVLATYKPKVGGKSKTRRRR